MHSRTSNVAYWIYGTVSVDDDIVGMAVRPQLDERVRHKSVLIVFLFPDRREVNDKVGMYVLPGCSGLSCFRQW